MPEAFDPYYKWLAIAPEDQPPDCYRLLGVRTFEDDPDVIENASDQRMAHLRTFQSGKHSAESQKLLNEVAQAKVLLLNPEKKAKYDETLREQMRIRAEGGDDEEISSQLTGFLRAVELDDQFAAKPAGRTLPKATPLDLVRCLIASRPKTAGQSHRREPRKPVVRQERPFSLLRVSLARFYCSQSSEFGQLDRATTTSRRLHPRSKATRPHYLHRLHLFQVSHPLPSPLPSLPSRPPKTGRSKT